MSSPFIAVGENIHCTRKYKVGGKYVGETSDGQSVIRYDADGAPAEMPVPTPIAEGADWTAGYVRHCAAAMWHVLHGDQSGKADAEKYICALAKAQESAGATYLDINVDEFSTDDEERTTLMEWAARVAQSASSLPLSIDSSNPVVLKAGLAACDTSRDAPMLNSVSLERADAIGLAEEFNACVIASASGESDLPNTTADRLANLDSLMPRLAAAGIVGAKLHVDPLVFPMSTDPANGKLFIEAVAAIRGRYGSDIHIVAGLSNISFGMPHRKLLNQVFTHLAVQAGGDGGIVDPLHINQRVLADMDPNSKSYELARAALMGEDVLGMNYIAAFRAGDLF